MPDLTKADTVRANDEFTEGYGTCLSTLSGMNAYSRDHLLGWANANAQIMVGHAARYRDEPMTEHETAPWQVGWNIADRYIEYDNDRKAREYSRNKAAARNAQITRLAQANNSPDSA